MFSLLLLMGLCGTSWSADYDLPSEIQDGNILHCFNWPIKEIKAELANITAAGFGSIQISPCQRGDVSVGSPWHDLYRPYDLAFKSSGYCSEADLQSLCQEAANYGIKIIVDVVANHVDKTAGYHDTWWDSNGRVRWNGGINYGDRYSITHGQLGDYGDINSEDSEVCARGKAYVEKLKSLGVKGIRWDAAKHIGLPSEGCGFWSSVTSVPGMYHYGEILDAPGPNAGIIKEYANYMSVTDNKYSNGAARNNGGIPGGYGGAWVVDYSVPDTKLVYWAESHDTYSNDEWSQNVDQSVIDRAYASYACRNGATALYLSRPNTKGFNNIKVGKGSTAFTGKHIAAVNKFRNQMQGRKDWCEATGNTFCVTRQDGGAVIVMKGSGNVSVVNGGGYCPSGTYTDLVNGSSFTVTSSTITGNVGSCGIAVIIKDGVGPDPNPNPDPNPDPDPSGITIYYDNSATNWSSVNIHYWNTPNTSWPGTPMTKVEGNIWKYTFSADPSTLTGFLFCDAAGKNQTADYTKAPIANHIYKGAGGTKGAVTDEGEYRNDPTPVKPIVTASPAGGTFSSTVNVTLNVNPSTASIYYTTDGSNPSAASSKYTSTLTFESTTTLKAMGVASDGTVGDIVTYTFTKSSTPGPEPQPGNNLVTDYYKVNPNGKVGTCKTINVTGHPATNAFSNWSENELIAQGVARDVCQAFKGVHERPIVDSYALYAAYDNDNLYLGVQYVYTIWDLGGEGKQGRESKPYNMDGKLCIAFDLDPNKSAKGITNENTSIWQNDIYTTFENGVDAWWFGSTKPGVGTPGFFVPNANGICDYTDPNSCKVSEVKYGYTDGLLPSITAVYGQDDFSYDPELLKGNAGFTDLRSEIDDDAHTFYEFKFPLSMMGITADYIKNNGIGVMVVDYYGASAHASLPYDPSFYDNVFAGYSQDNSSSKEKEDQDVVTYAPARIGKLLNSTPTAIENIVITEETEPEYYNLQGMRVKDPTPGIYIVRRGNKTSKEVVR